LDEKRGRDLEERLKISLKKIQERFTMMMKAKRDR
jgi:hypothetical protein